MTFFRQLWGGDVALLRLYTNILIKHKIFQSYLSHILQQYQLVFKTAACLQIPG